MKRTIRWQLIFSFLALSFLIIGPVGWVTSRLMDVYFQDYMVDRKEAEVAEYITELEDAYQTGAGFDERKLSDLAMIAMHADLSFRLYDETGKELWSSGSGMGHSMGMSGSQHMHGGMMHQRPGNYAEKAYPLQSGGKTIGKAVFLYPEPKNYSKDDQQFISRMKQNFLAVGIVAFLFSIFFAGWVAQKFSRPLIRVNAFTKAISKGEYKQLPSDTAIVEMNELIDSVNDLSFQLQQQEIMRDQLSRDLAHEIRTPLATLKGNLEAMIDGIWAPTPARLGTCYHEIERMTRLIGNIEKLNEMESQSLVLHPSVFDLKDLSSRIAANFEALAKEKELSVSVEGEAVSIEADKDKISQLITNLLANAVKFTPPGGKITLSATKENQQAEWKIQDTGKGLSTEEQQHIFDRFYMVEPSRNSRLGGQGIGLSIVKSIVKAHRGTISVESSPGKGTTFIVRLPLSS